MKKGKLLLLLVAIMSLTVAFAACDNTSAESGTGTDAPSGSLTENGTASDVVSTEAPAEETIAEVKDEQESATHELLNYFELPKAEEADVLASIKRLDGELSDWDSELNLAVVEIQDLDHLNNVVRTISVYDLISDEVIHTESVSYPYKGKQSEIVELKVTLEEYVIRVLRTTYSFVNDGVDPDDESDDVYEAQYEATYYPIMGGEAIYSTNDNTFAKKVHDNGLASILMGDKLFWIDKDFNIIRSVDSIVAGNYDVDFANPDDADYRSEYKGYLYSWNTEKLYIFNRSGMVSGYYNAAPDSTISVDILNNGNALIQEFTRVGATDSCDFVLSGTRYTLQSYIMNLVDGKMEEVELDFIVSDLETAYEQENRGYVEAKLKNGIDSYATVYRFANGEVAKSAVIYVLDNDLNVLYTVENKTPGANLNEAFALASNRFYLAAIQNTNQEYYAIFDYDGNLISPYNIAGGITSKYWVSYTAIYDYAMNCVYDFSKNGYVFDNVVNDNIYLTKQNFVTGCEELYVIKPDSKAPELVCDGVDYQVLVTERYYIVYDIENTVYRLYNVAGEELLVSYEVFGNVASSKDAIVFYAFFQGEPILYIVK